MNLNYRVLWFDDNREFFESLNIATLYDTIRAWGFEPSIEFVETPDAFMKEAPFTAFDLIAVDFNLALHEQHGGDFVRGIRENGTFTEVIFYSNSPSGDLWNAIREKELEGVYIANRQGVIDKIERVGYQTVRKVLDLNNMRGLVMAEVGELDHALDAVIRKGFAIISAEQGQEILDAFLAKANKNATEHKEKLDAFKDKPDVDAMLALCDSNKRWECFGRLRKKLVQLRAQTIGDFVGEILSPRNFLAHGTPEIIDRGFRFNFNGKSYDFNEDVALALRQTILKYKKQFGEIDASIAEPGAPQKHT